MNNGWRVHPRGDSRSQSRRTVSRGWRVRLDRFVLRIGAGALAAVLDHAIARRRRRAVVEFGHADPGRTP